jgi:peptide/nickel transport system permease protein
MKSTIIVKRVMVCFIVIFMIAGHGLVMHDPFEQNLSERLEGPSFNYPMGTDTLGRCVYSRIVSGGQATVQIVLLSGVVLLVAGTIIGSMQVFSKPRFAMLIETVINAFTAFPPMLYVLLFVGIWGGGTFTMIVSLVFSNWARVAKLVQGKVEAESKKAYVLCARACGAPMRRIIFVHVIPNCFMEILGYMSLISAEMIILIASFSFIGIGLGEDTINWGQMIAEGKSKIRIQPGMTLYPSIAIILFTFLFNYIGKEDA